MAPISSLPVTVVLDLAKLGITNPTFSQAWGTVQMKLTQLTIRGNLRVAASITSDAVAPTPAPPPPVEVEPPAPPPPPPAPPTESAHGSEIPPFTQLVDSVLATWTVTDGIVYRDGVATISANVTLLLYFNDLIYQQNSAGNWWSWQGGSQGQWIAATDPRASTSGSAPSPMPTLSVERHPNDLLELGAVGTRTYRIEDNRWGSTGISEGTGSSNFAQAVGRSTTVGPFGEVAWRTTWTWPQFVNGVNVEAGGFSEVKAYPGIIYGAKPGHDANPASQYPAWSYAVRLPDGAVVATPPAGTPSNIASDWVANGGSVSTRSPSGTTPGTHLPIQLPLVAGSFTTTGRFSASATGKGHLSFDIWLQAESTQAHGFAKAPVTHEIMIPLRNWGQYGMHGVPAGRNSGWYDHDVTIDGVLYHVYCAKNLQTNPVTKVSDLTWPDNYPGLQYNFGSELTGGYINEETGSARKGWKFIVFQCDGDSHPLQADGSFRIDIVKFMDHLATRTDSRGIGFIQGTEYVVSSELGIEPVYGTGTMTCWDYRARS